MRLNSHSNISVLGHGGQVQREHFLIRSCRPTLSQLNPQLLRQQNRYALGCKFCLKIQETLPVHLRRTCTKNASPAEIDSLVSEAREKMCSILKGLTIIEYKDLDYKDSDPLEFFVTFLEKRGCYIKGKPVQPTRTSRIQPEDARMCEAASHDIARPLQEQMPITVELSAPADESDGIDEEEQIKEEQEESELIEEEEEEEEESEHIEEEEDNIEDGVDDIDEDQQLNRTLTTQWTKNTRAEMMKAGLYKRHSLNAPLMKGFTSYLQETLGVIRYQHEVENVARFLYFINPMCLNMSFVKDIKRVNQFFTKLKGILMSQTMFNYLKHIRRFVNFQMNSTNLRVRKPSLFKDCSFFLKVTEDIQKRLRKGISLEVVRKRYYCITIHLTSPEDCRRLLREAKESFLRAIQEARTKRTVGEEKKLLILYYLEALLVLKHLQTPGVVQNMTVSEWTDRLHYNYTWENNQLSLTVVAVETHKTATQQVATFALTEEEEQWFNIYYEKIRPTLLQKNNSPEEIFFLSSTGQKIYNVSNDLWRLHKRFDLPNFLSQTARRVCEKWTVAQYSDSERYLFAKYLTHTSTTADRCYREKTLNDICHASILVSQIGSRKYMENQPSTSRNAASTSSAATSSQIGMLSKCEQKPVAQSTNPREEAFQKFTEKFPLDLDSLGLAPKAAMAVSKAHGQYFSDRWRKTQNKMRIDYIAGCFKKGKPKEEEVKRLIESKRWKQNVPQVKKVLEQLQHSSKT
ncbi:uncharacterized protein LOC122919824 [Bufo gargarizans]|uniref:uncharacterized protein LOC122919824 n=1 Tax=Bufo gargarizans TaxID=30331 RepID=UPI001CF0E827|nr:uncharacterized protein LOC122919824 [Bufo gargarizans]